MALDLDTILAPISEEQPSGEDLSYDNERTELEQAFESSESGDDGDGAEKDWRAILKLIENQFARTKDVWLAVYLARAGAASGSLETVDLGVQALAGLFEGYWDTVHPQLEELGVPGRKAPCDALSNRRSFLAPLERTVLLQHPRLGRFTGADFERFRSEGAAAEGYGLFRAALDELGVEALGPAVERLESIEEGLRRADRAFTAGAEGEETPNYAPVYAVLSQIKAALRSFLPGESDGAEAEGDDGYAEGGGGSGGGGAKRSVSGGVNSRDDVIRALDMIGAYYRANEPSHPLPLMLERAKGWVTMDFYTLMKDLAPDGLDQMERVLKQRSGIFDEE